MSMRSLAFATAVATVAFAAPAAAEWRGSFSVIPNPNTVAMAAACAPAFAIQGGVFGTVRAVFPGVAGNGPTTNITLFSDHVAVNFTRSGAIPTGTTTQPVTVSVLGTRTLPIAGVKARYNIAQGLTPPAGGTFAFLDMIVERFNGVPNCNTRIFIAMAKTPALPN